MAPKEVSKCSKKRRDVAVDASPCHHWPKWRLIREVRIVDPGRPQPDDELKMEQIVAELAAAVPDSAELWGPDGVPRNGYPADDPRQARRHAWLRYLL